MTSFCIHLTLQSLLIQYLNILFYRGFIEKDETGKKEKKLCPSKSLPNKQILYYENTLQQPGKLC